MRCKPILQALLTVELLKPPAKEVSLEAYLSKSIATRWDLNTPKGVDRSSAERQVRKMCTEGCLYENCKGDSKNGDALNFKINAFLRSLQQEVLATEGWPSAALQQEARNALAANKAEDTAEVRDFFERIWGPLRNP